MDSLCDDVSAGLHAHGDGVQLAVLDLERHCAVQNRRIDLMDLFLHRATPVQGIIL
jgi:hypothetical protein